MASLKSRLQDAYLRHHAQLPPLAWTSERERWNEFVFCLVASWGPADAADARKATEILSATDALSVAALSATGTPNDAEIVVAFVLKSHGFSPDEAARCSSSLRNIATVLSREFEGKLQRYLRSKGEAMRNELVALFRNAEVEQSQLRLAVSHWLQNVLNLPVSIEHPAVLAFCEESGESLSDLQHAADELDMNLAVIDDLLILESKASDTYALE